MHDELHPPPAHRQYIPGNGNGNKLNRRLEMLERLLRASGGDGLCARTNSLRQALRRNRSDMADDTAKSLDVLRQVFQADLTEEIKQVIDRYVRSSFTPAFENLRRNGHEVTESDIAKLCVDILDGAKTAFALNVPPPPQMTAIKPMPAVTDDECGGSSGGAKESGAGGRVRCLPGFTALLKPLAADNGQPQQQQNIMNMMANNSGGVPIQAQQQQTDSLLKVYESDGNESDGASLVSFNSSLLNIQTGFSSDCRQMQQKQTPHHHQQQQQQHLQLKRRGRPKKAEMADTGRSGTPVMNGRQPISVAEAIKWSPSRFTSESRFVIASKVNRLLGFSSRGGGHLFSVYSRAFRYVADEEDRVWLFQRGLTKWAASGSGKLFVMALEDVVEIAEQEGIDVSARAVELQRCAFTGPERMLIKMRAQMVGPFEQLRARVLPTVSGGGVAAAHGAPDSVGAVAQAHQHAASSSAGAAALYDAAAAHQHQHAPPPSQGGFVPAFHL
ncbi:hypothetical protein niasHT_005824 [Heterodera trifolii]|uniref:DNTTIP1 dimerisation domain-containing protein n=1 Tax=Heterodera trifolii TaxID=157864 RepID=A0ABD2LQF0_9BILA